MRPVTYSHYDSKESRDIRRDWRAERAKWNERSPAERFDKAAAIFLRLAILARVKPVPGSPIHHHAMHHAQGGPAANPNYVHIATRELYGWPLMGMEDAKPALDMLTLMAGDAVPDTTGFPSITPAQIRAGYHLAKAGAKGLRKEQAERELNAAYAAAASRVAWFFAYLGGSVARA